MEIIIVIIMSVLLIASNILVYNISPKEIQTVQNVDNNTEVITTTETKTTTMQGQVTINIYSEGFITEYYNINFNDFTNIFITRSSNSNKISKTNR